MSKTLDKNQESSKTSCPVNYFTMSFPSSLSIIKTLSRTISSKRFKSTLVITWKVMFVVNNPLEIEVDPTTVVLYFTHEELAVWRVAIIVLEQDLQATPLNKTAS